MVSLGQGDQRDMVGVCSSIGIPTHLPNEPDGYLMLVRQLDAPRFVVFVCGGEQESGRGEKRSLVRPYDIHVTLRNVGIRDNIMRKVFGHTLTYVLGGFKERNVHR